jgi:ABC-type transporter Mla subunit MlaD
MKSGCRKSPGAEVEQWLSKSMKQQTDVPFSAANMVDAVRRLKSSVTDDFVESIRSRIDKLRAESHSINAEISLLESLSLTLSQLTSDNLDNFGRVINELASGM